MKIIGTKISGGGKIVYQVILGKEELALIFRMSERLYKELPNHIENLKAKNRLREFLKTIPKNVL